jgi:hypothetical protein
MHRLSDVVDRACTVLIDDLELELEKLKSCHHMNPCHDAMIHEVRETLDALGDAIHIKYHMGWLEPKASMNPHNPY